MGGVKKMYQSLIDTRTLYDSVPVEFTMSTDELEEFEFLSNLNSINVELQIISNSDQAEKEIA